MASFSALVARLASSVERTTIRCCAVSRDVTKFSTGVAFHGLGLAVPCEVIRSTAFIAGSRPGPTSKTAPAKTTVAATANRGTASDSHTGRVRACSGKMTRLTAVVTAAVTTSTTQAQSRAVGLDVSKPLAVIALLRLGGTRKGALVGLMSYKVCAVS
ncbi:uncharacterized protein F4812DRAFT_226819 [Daldinia caldariorum]|uniref:uncharacterized protein n=1 Tax=Daldinia caldariorum TaxID=326644 RepID=UPI0020074A94|nr:uncharacterized protein F4812DRAFT_226819 [Daldinia caldariorum]KAI1463917.1 hypothetical protein F4812DRAFT_226819 [Daldinia caldariorum]